MNVQLAVEHRVFRQDLPQLFHDMWQVPRLAAAAAQNDAVAFPVGQAATAVQLRLNVTRIHDVLLSLGERLARRKHGQ